MTSGAEAGRIVVIPEGTLLTVGRSPDCMVSVADTALSRVHARVACVAGEFVLADARSTNGTFVNDERVETSVGLRTEDRVRLGPSTTLCSREQTMRMTPPDGQ